MKTSIHTTETKDQVTYPVTKSPDPTTPMSLTVSSTIASYKKHGITKNQVASMLINLFHYPAAYRDTLDQYYILHWTGAYFKEQIKDGCLSVGTFDGTLVKNITTNYMVVYQECTPFNVARAARVRLSFRKPAPEFGLQAYVIVRIL